MADKPLVINTFVPLSPDECAERERLDNELDKNEDGMIAYIRDLKAYRDKLLWRGFYPSFESYLQSRRKRFTRTRQRFGQLVRMTEVLDALTSAISSDGKPLVAVLPDKERQTRELLALSDPTEMAAAWLGAQVASGESQPAYGWVRSSVETLVEAKNTIGSVVDTGEDGEVPVAIGFAEATANKEIERIDRMRDHIKANRKSKPLVVFEGVFESSYLDDSEDCFTFIGRTEKKIEGLEEEQRYRFVVYAIPEKRG